MDLMHAIQGRRSVRAFRPDAVNPAHLAAMIDAAAWAPSPHGRQPWRFVILTQAAIKQQLAAVMGTTWRTHLAQDGLDAASIERRYQRSLQRISQAPAIIIACLYLEDLDPYPDAQRQAAETTMAIQSLGCAIQNMLLTAYALGLGTGWMCAPLFCPHEVRSCLNLAADLHPHALIPVGYPAHIPTPKPRHNGNKLVIEWT
ncbi:nitroreductase [Oscillochloris trichoides DG-6]|uniref:Nitroreductase n=1 Tax=Oscillochloris trichoides DG-6 TaxID=765420 RepID=E1IDB3_9CHLR|nr:nitroreductase family protein [Oscillochloris trichoides]EFO80790.1 nitroreductase [Oscillochloris trichoides DG-6]